MHPSRRVLMAEPVIVKFDGKTIEATPCSKAHRAHFESGLLILTCRKCQLRVKPEEPADA